MSDLEVAPRRPELAPEDRRLLIAAATPPLAWLCQLGFGAASIHWLCAIGSRLPLHWVTAAALAAALFGLLRCRRRLADHAPDDARRARRAVAAAGVGMGALFVLLILATAIPGLVLEPCR